MQKYTDVVRNTEGRAIAGASVTIRTYPGGALADLYEDDETTALPNPLTTNALGTYSFKAADGEYSRVTSGTGITTLTELGVITLFDTDSAPNDLYGVPGSTGIEWWSARFLLEDPWWAGAACGPSDWDGVVAGSGGEYDIVSFTNAGTYKLWASYQGWEHSDHSGVAVIAVKDATTDTARTVLECYSAADVTGANRVRITSANAAGIPVIGAAGAGANISLKFQPKGVGTSIFPAESGSAIAIDVAGRVGDDIGSIRFLTNALSAEVGRLQFQNNNFVVYTGPSAAAQAVFYHVASSTSYLAIQGSTSQNPTIYGEGVGDVNLIIAGKNNGFVKTPTSFAVGTSVAPVAAGSTAGGIFLSSVANFGIFFGTGAPTFTAAQGSLYIRRDGGASTRLYSNTSGAATWSAITSA